MGQVHVPVVLTNYREEVLARLGQLPAERVHRYETEALIDTGAYQSVLPPAVADRLGLLRLGHTVAQMADGVVVGSAIVRQIETNLERLEPMVRSLAEKMKR